MGVGEEDERGQWTNLAVCRGPWPCRGCTCRLSPLGSLACSARRGCSGDIIDLFVVLAEETQVFPWELILTSGRGKRRCQPRQPSLWNQRQTRLLPSQPNSQTQPFWLSIPFIQHRLVCLDQESLNSESLFSTKGHYYANQFPSVDLMVLNQKIQISL